MTAALRGDHMERKEYTAPETEIVEFETTDAVSGSLTGYEEGELPVISPSGQRI